MELNLPSIVSQDDAINLAEYQKINEESLRSVGVSFPSVSPVMPVNSETKMYDAITFQRKVPDDIMQLLLAIREEKDLPYSDAYQGELLRIQQKWEITKDPAKLGQRRLLNLLINLTTTVYQPLLSVDFVMKLQKWCGERHLQIFEGIMFTIPEVNIHILSTILIVLENLWTSKLEDATFNRRVIMPLIVGKSIVEEQQIGALTSVFKILFDRRATLGRIPQNVKFTFGYNRSPPNISLAQRTKAAWRAFTNTPKKKTTRPRIRPPRNQ